MCGFELSKNSIRGFESKIRNVNSVDTLFTIHRDFGWEKDISSQILISDKSFGLSFNIFKFTVNQLDCIYKKTNMY